MAGHVKTERNERILAEYQAGDSYRDLALRYGVTESRICRIVHRWGGAPLLEELAAKRKLLCSKGGRKPVWPDCPEHLRERYEKAKKRIGAHAAKVRIEAQERMRLEIEARGPVRLAA